MTLWQLLILLCFVMPIGGALGPAKVAKVGFVGYMLAIMVGLAVGASSAWMMWIMHKVVSRNLQQRPDEVQSVSEWYFRGFYLSKILWIVISSLLGAWLSSLLLRLVL